MLRHVDATSLRTRAPLLSVLMLGCFGGTPGDDVIGEAGPTVRPTGVPAAWKGEPLKAGASRTLVLDRMPMTLTLAERNRAADEATRASFVFTGDQLRSEEGGNWSIPVPFHVPKAERRMAPTGMKVLVDGEEASFSSSLAGGGRMRGVTWLFHGEDLRVRTQKRPSRLEILNPNVLRQARRLNWAESREDGRSPDEFVHYGMNASLGASGAVSQQSREGLLLPAPSVAAWKDLTLPPGARFEAQVALAPPPLPSVSDGAAVELVWVTAAGETTLGRHEVPAGPTAFTTWALDLSARAGETGTLELRTLPGGNAVDDYVFVASPVVSSPSTGNRHVVVIGIDTLRPDHLSVYGYGRPTSPELDAWAQSAVVFDRAWTAAPRTRPSFRAATTGRLPLQAVCAKNIGAVFDEAGFATAGIVANPHLNPRFDFQAGFDLWWLDGDAKVNTQVDRALDWMKAHEDRDTYLFLHIMDPHLNYIAPKVWQDKFTAALAPLEGEQKLPAATGRATVYSWMNRGLLTELRKEHLIARYDAEIAYTSNELSRLFAYLDTLGEQTTVVIHNDHGEELWDHGGFEHNHQVYDETTRAVLIVRPPGGTGQQGARSASMAQLEDIGPTVYALAGLTDNLPASDGISLVPALRGEVEDERPVPIAHIQYEADRWAVVWHDHKYILWTGTGREELYDLVADPHEANDLSASADLTAYREQLAEAHGLALGPGWRVGVDLPPGTQITLALPATAVVADVLDPELITRHPVNQEWGEVPPILPEDVGLVALSEDKRTLTFTAGSKGKGTLWVRFTEDVSVDGVVVTAGAASATTARGAAKLEVGTVKLTAGTVFDPPLSEFDRMQQCLRGTASASEIELLKELGYMQGGGHLGEDGEHRD